MTDLESRVWCWVRFLVAVFAVLAVVWLATGCDRLTRGVEDERRLQMDCAMETPDGTVMRCRQDLEKNIDTDDDSISIKHPAGGG